MGLRSSLRRRGRCAGDGTDRVSGQGSDRGVAATEMAIITPALIAVFVLAVFGARVVWAERLTQSAAASAARAASQQQTAGAAEQRAVDVARSNLADAGLSCDGGPRVDVALTRFGSGGQVTVTVVCTTLVSDLATVAPSPGSYTFSHTSTE